MIARIYDGSHDYTLTHLEYQEDEDDFEGLFVSAAQGSAFLVRGMTIEDLCRHGYQYLQNKKKVTVDEVP